ncbi:hypothetical protein [Rubrivivax sp. A210]|uniref:hypothetical protein n=1 Tax=Rubrivivax sp. A210 TaxID=2772301 RepID=UPI0019197654|nr:hypothetical protein [Rubrivivax sp. A210]
MSTSSLLPSTASRHPGLRWLLLAVLLPLLLLALDGALLRPGRLLTAPALAPASAAAPAPREAEPGSRPLPAEPPTATAPASAAAPPPPLAAACAPDAALRERALQNLGAALDASADERVRAAHLFLRARLAVDAEARAQAIEADAACRRARADGLEETAQRCAEALGASEAALLQPAAAAVDSLAVLATASRDPAVQRLAYRACHGGGLSFVESGAACQRITTEHWAGLDGEQALPWLQRAGQAHSLGDLAAVDAALWRAAQAPVGDAWAGTLAGLVAGALPAGTPPLEHATVLAVLAEVEAAESPPLGAQLVTLCGGEALQQATRADACAALAEMLVVRGRSAAAAMAGVQIGERLGWPAERSSALVRELRAALDARLRHAMPACGAGRQRQELALLDWQQGELEAGRELLRRDALGAPR